MTRQGVNFPSKYISRRRAISGDRPTPQKSRPFLPGGGEIRGWSLALLDTVVYPFSTRPAGLMDTTAHLSLGLSNHDRNLSRPASHHRALLRRGAINTNAAALV
jgi:hypothetical protein